MSECPACTAAERTPRAYAYRAGCRSCQARALAATGAHLESAALGKQTARYAKALKTMFGEDRAAAGHERVKTWAARIVAADALMTAVHAAGRAAVDKRQGVKA